MNEVNTTGVGSILKAHNLDYIPEAHSYLKIDNKVIDITRNQVSENSFEKCLLKEIEIIPEQIGDYKLKLHQQFLKQWLKTENSPLAFKSLWDIREACIIALSNKKPETN